MITWRKSTHSSDMSGNCVEVADLGPQVGLRDSKDPKGGHLSVTAGAFAALVNEIKRNELDR